MQAKETWVMNLATIVMVFAFSMPALAVPGDMDLDGDVDRSDFALFYGCFMGPQTPVPLPGCENARFDADSDVDLSDLGGFQAAFTGSCTGQLPNDSCHCPMAIGDGTRSYSNVGATTDGPEHLACDFGFEDSGQVGSDIWYCYTASCTSTALASLCGSAYDTKLAVYAGCGCPTAAPLECSDDNCRSGAAVNRQSRVTFSVSVGQSYLVRVGGYFGEQGDGRLTIGCNVDACANGSGDCLTPSPTGAPRCGDATCCTMTCDLDPFCCEVTWDQTCADEAEGVCDGSFRACAPGSGSCGVSDTTPGCGVDCCNKVCMVDPFCCLRAWDATCVGEAEEMCFAACIPSAGPCSSAHVSPGCNLEPCCEAVCSEDSYCCDNDWDQTCVNEATALTACHP